MEHRPPKLPAPAAPFDSRQASRMVLPNSWRTWQHHPQLIAAVPRHRQTPRYAPSTGAANSASNSSCLACRSGCSASGAPPALPRAAPS